MSLEEGQHFGSYEILNPLGRGGMGEVYLAIDRRLKRKVAIKILSESLIENRDQLLRFRKEALVAAVLNHPNICTIYESGEVNGTTFIAMEYVEGETLRHYLASRHLSIDVILDYGLQIADALKEAHRNNIIHRDIKTSNIILTQRKTIKILDFGLAKQLSHQEQNNFSEASTDYSSGPGAPARGTTPYMPPEGLLGKKIDQRSDIFSFGVVLYEMLTGQLPFKGASNIEIVDAILHNEPTSIIRYNEKVPEALVRIVQKMLEKDPEMRYQSAHEVWTDLVRLKEERVRTESLAVLSGSKPQVRPKSLSTKSLALVLTLVGIAAIASVFYLTRSRTSSTPVQGSKQLETIAVIPFKYKGDTEHKYFGSLITDALIAGLESEPGFSVAPYATINMIDENESIQETAKKLGVKWIVRGEVNSRDSIVEMKPEIFSSDGKRIWGNNIQSSPDGIISTLTQMKNVLVSQLKHSDVSEGKGVGQLRTPNPEAYKLYIQAQSYYEKWDKEENLEEAISLLRKSLEIDPDSAATHAGLAMALNTKYVRTRSPASLVEATSEAQRALILASDLPEAQIANGLVQLQRGNSVEAKNSFSKALDLAPGNDAACSYVASMYEKLGRNDEAKEMYEQAIALRPSYWSNYYDLGTFLYFSMGDFENAKPPLLKATELYPDGAAPLIVLGYLDLYMGNLSPAEQSFQKVLKRSPDVAARNGLGVVYIYQGKNKLALELFQDLAKEVPDQVIYQINIADALRALGNQEEATKYYMEAIKTFRSLLASNPSDDANKAGLAMALSAVGDCTQALNEIKSVYSGQKESPELAGYALITAGRCNDIQWATPIALDAIRSKNLVDILYHHDLQKLREEPVIKKALQASGLQVR